MNSERWQRIQSLFHDAVDLPADEREAFLRAACGDDHQLLADVRPSIEEDRRGASLLDRGVAYAASRVLRCTRQSPTCCVSRTVSLGGLRR